MLKGVNRQVVDIPQPDSAYFERVIFFVKPEFSGLSEKRLQGSADEMIRSASPPPSPKKRYKRSERFIRGLKLTLAALAGSAVTALGMLVAF